MKTKNIFKIICSILGVFGTLIIGLFIIVFLIWHRQEAIIEGKIENLQGVEIVYYTSVLYGESESIMITDKDEMELIYNTIKETNIDKIQYNREWGGEAPEWCIILYFEDGEEYYDNGVSSRNISYGIHKFFGEGDDQEVITGSNEALYALIDEIIEQYIGKIYNAENAGYVSSVFENL